MKGLVTVKMRVQLGRNSPKSCKRRPRVFALPLKKTALEKPELELEKPPLSHFENDQFVNVKLFLFRGPDSRNGNW